MSLNDIKDKINPWFVKILYAYRPGSNFSDNPPDLWQRWELSCPFWVLRNNFASDMTAAMYFEPRDAARKLEFDKVLDLLQKEALTPMAAEILSALHPSLRFDDTDRQLRETRDFKLAIEKNDRFPLDAFEDIRPALRMLDIDGYTLQTESFQQILHILLLTRDVFRFFAQGAKKEIYPKLYDIIRPMSFDEGLIKAIMAVFDEKGNIRPDASP
jgi:DNA mismatch repair protein MutS2